MIRLTFLGDISLNDAYIDAKKQGLEPFGAVRQLVKDSMLVTGNLECTAIGSEGENLAKKPRLKTTEDTLNYLKDFRLNLALLANNHVYDNLGDGFRRTLSFLERNGIAYCGAASDPDGASRPFKTELAGKQFIFLNYVTSDTHLNMPEGSDVWVNAYDKKKILAEIQHFRPQCEYLVLLPHWGGKLEGAILPERYQQKDAHEFIDAGVDLVIGHHSHILQPYEKYRGKYIFYSLGNFCFSDIVFEGKIIPINRKPGYNYSAILEVIIGTDSISCKLKPIRNVNLNIIPLVTYPFRYKLVQRLFILLMLPPFWDLYFFWFTKVKGWIYRMKTQMKDLF